MQFIPVTIKDFIETCHIFSKLQNLLSNKKQSSDSFPLNFYFEKLFNR